MRGAINRFRICKYKLCAVHVRRHHLKERHCSNAVKLRSRRHKSDGLVKVLHFEVGVEQYLPVDYHIKR